MTILDVSPRFKRLLSNAGWSSGRQVVTLFWLRDLRSEGFVSNATAEELLDTLGDLHVYLPPVGDSTFDYNIHFDPVLAASGDYDQTELWEAILGIKLFPLGQEIKTNQVLWSGNDGKFYLGRGDTLYFLGATFREAMDRMAFSSEPLQIACVWT